MRRTRLSEKSLSRVVFAAASRVRIAGHFWVEELEHPAGIVSPHPDVKRVMSGQSGNRSERYEVKLSSADRRWLGVCCVPCVLRDEILDRPQSHGPVLLRLVVEQLGISRIDDVVEHSRWNAIVESHTASAELARDAWAHLLKTIRQGRVDLEVWRSRLSNECEVPVVQRNYGCTVSRLDIVG